MYQALAGKLHECVTVTRAALKTKDDEIHSLQVALQQSHSVQATQLQTITRLQSHIAKHQMTWLGRLQQAADRSDNNQNNHQNESNQTLVSNSPAGHSASHTSQHNSLHTQARVSAPKDVNSSPSRISTSSSHRRGVSRPRQAKVKLKAKVVIDPQSRTVSSTDTQARRRAKAGKSARTRKQTQSRSKSRSGTRIWK